MSGEDAGWVKDHPECRREAAVPAGGVKDFDNAFFINHMVNEFVLKRKVEGEAEVKCDECDEDEPVVGYCPDCNLFVCHICNKSHKRNKRYRGHGIVPLAELKSNKDVSIQPKPKVPVCREHEYELKHYCESCDELVCLYCTIKEHNGYNHDTVKKVADKHRKELKEITAPVDEMIKGLAETHLLNITDTKKKIRKHGEDVNKEIEQHYDRVIQQLIEQRDQLKQQARNTLSQEEKVVTTRLEEVEYAPAETMSMKELNDALEKSSDQEVLSAKKQVTDRMQQLTNKYKKLKAQPVQSAVMEFIPIKQPFPQLRLLCSTAKPDPHNCETADIIPGYTFVGKEVKFTIITNDYKGCRCYQEDNQVSVHLGVKATTQIKDNKDGSYIASFNTLQVGQVKVSVLVNGEHIERSPYSVIVRHHYTSISKPSKIINNNGDMGQPWGIGFSRNGKWAVANHSNHCVYLYDGEDQLVKKIGDRRSSNNDHFFGPEGVAFDDDGHLYIGDCSNRRVQKFNNNGDYLMHFGKLGYENGHLKHPKGLTIHNDKVYVVDSTNIRISVFFTNGTFHQIIGRQQLRSPRDVAITRNNQLLVVDLYHHCIYRFTLDGNYIVNLKIVNLEMEVGIKR